MSDWAEHSIDNEEYDSYVRKQDKKLHKLVKYKYESVVHETSKAMLLRLPEGNKTWFPKKYCKLQDSNVHIPQWLVNVLRESKQIV